MSSHKSIIPLFAICQQAGYTAPVLPLSDSTNEAGWELLESVSDEFNGDSLDGSKGHTPDNPVSAFRYHTAFHDWRKGSETFGERSWTNDHTLDFRVADDFHVYGLEWDPDFLRLYVDGNLIHAVTRQELGTRWIDQHAQKVWIDSETFDWEVRPGNLKASDFGEKSKFLIDYCRIWKRTRPSSGLAPRRNLLANSSFEEGLDGWAGEGEVSQDAQSGKGAALLKVSGKMPQTVTVKPSTTYVLSAWAKSPKTDGRNLWFKSLPASNLFSFAGVPDDRSPSRLDRHDRKLH